MVKEALNGSCRCILLLGCLLSVAAGYLAPRSSWAAESSQDVPESGKKGAVCLVPARGGNVDSAPGALGAGTIMGAGRLTGSGIVSFFSGTVKKIGFGAPDCFFLNGRKAPPLSFMETVSAGMPLPRAIAAEAADSPSLFPAAGYYGRFARSGRSGLAVGVGVDGFRRDELADDTLSPPSAKVAMVFGIGF